MNRWDVNQTRKYVEQLYGHEQLTLVRPCIQSVIDRQLYARIHFRDAQSKLKAYVGDALQHVDLMGITLTGDNETWGDLNVFIREVGAYLTACVQSIHSIPDILSHATYYSLGINLEKGFLPPHLISVRTVSASMKDKDELSGLRALLDELVREDSFSHLSGLANRAKHRSIVAPALNEDWTSERAERHRLVFPEFVYREFTYPQVFADDLLSAEYERCAKLVVAAGIELNAILERRVTDIAARAGD